MAAPAGWYPDPTAGGAQRWWDGHKWAPPQAQQSNPYAPPGPYTQRPALKSSGLAVVLTFLWPGVGHFYLGLTKRGLPYFLVNVGFLALAFLTFGLSFLFSVLSWLVTFIIAVISITGDTAKVNQVLSSGQEVYDA
jgi:hypothetical protein